jgi:uncharacterized protein (DUF302 family)
MVFFKYLETNMDIFKNNGGSGMMDIRYEKKVDKSFDGAVESLKRNLEENKFGVLWELNFKDKLREKGLEFDTNFKIFEVCNPVQAKEVLIRDIEVGYFLPCKMVVYEKEGSVFVGMLNPAGLIGLMGKEDLKNIADEVGSVLSKVIDNV